MHDLTIGYNDNSEIVHNIGNIIIQIIMSILRTNNDDRMIDNVYKKMI